MLYESSRSGSAERATSAEAIVRGIAADGGLYTPVEVPVLADSVLRDAIGQSYVERAFLTLRPYFEDFADDVLRASVCSAYGADRFDSPKVAPLSPLTDREAILELWHGPTSAFKDVALQLLPRLMSAAADMVDERRDILILVATSGDTGKAALEGFRDVPGTRVVVLYPSLGVSPIQRLQMVTQQGSNVCVLAVSGDFDDAQSGVKRLFADPVFISELASLGLVCSSANSINWGRLAPQIAYYVSAYCDAVSFGALRYGERVNFVVPSGNFGNILAAYYAMRMGVPVHRLICASNANNVLTDFIRTGTYDRRRVLHRTTSPSMDILVSSNLERLLYEVSHHDHELIRSLMRRLSEVGWYSVGEDLLCALTSVFWAGWCDERTAFQTIRKVYTDHGYVMDPHTAVGQAVYEQYVSESGDDTYTVLASTASPFKFAGTVVAAIAGPDAASSRSDSELLDVLSELIRLPAPASLSEVFHLPQRHLSVIDPAEIGQAVRSCISLSQS